MISDVLISGLIAGGLVAFPVFTYALECFCAEPDKNGQIACDPIFLWCPCCNYWNWCKKGKLQGTCNYDDTCCGCLGNLCHCLYYCGDYFAIISGNTFIILFLCPCLCERSKNCLMLKEINPRWEILPNCREQCCSSCIACCCAKDNDDDDHLITKQPQPLKVETTDPK